MTVLVFQKGIMRFGCLVYYILKIHNIIGGFGIALPIIQKYSRLARARAFFSVHKKKVLLQDTWYLKDVHPEAKPYTQGLMYFRHCHSNNSFSEQRFRETELFQR